MEIGFRDCGDCHVCCEGYLVHKVYGNEFGNGKECCFLVDKQCSIYKNRPISCSYYQCAWSQKLFPEWMKPNQCNVLISVQDDEYKRQYLNVIEMNDNVDRKVYEEIEKFVSLHNSYFIRSSVRKIIPIKYES